MMSFRLFLGRFFCIIIIIIIKPNNQVWILTRAGLNQAEAAKEWWRTQKWVSGGIYGEVLMHGWVWSGGCDQHSVFSGLDESVINSFNYSASQADQLRLTRERQIWILMMMDQSSTPGLFPFLNPLDSSIHHLPPQKDARCRNETVWLVYTQDNSK